MYPFNLKKTKEKYYTAIPSPIIDEVTPWLDRNSVEYEIVRRDEAPDTIPCGCTFRGKNYMWGYAYIVANIKSEELLKAVEEILWQRESEKNTERILTSERVPGSRQ